MVIPILGLFQVTSSAPEFSASYEFFPLKENAYRLVYREDVDGFGYQSDKEIVIADVNGKTERRVKFPINRRAISESKEMGVYGLESPRGFFEKGGHSQSGVEYRLLAPFGQGKATFFSGSGLYYEAGHYRGHLPINYGRFAAVGVTGDMETLALFQGYPDETGFRKFALKEIQYNLSPPMGDLMKAMVPGIGECAPQARYNDLVFVDPNYFMYMGNIYDDGKGDVVSKWYDGLAKIGPLPKRRQGTGLLAITRLSDGVTQVLGSVANDYSAEAGNPRENMMIGSSSGKYVFALLNKQVLRITLKPKG